MKNAGISADVGESSFIEEASFVQNPLNSRLAPQASSDLLREHQATDSLKGIPPEIQEALILEDLLSVLMVGRRASFDCFRGSFALYIGDTGYPHYAQLRT